MLIEFKVRNYLSFKDEVTFSMAGYGERIHPHHLIKAERRNDVSLLRSALIYGANASGKSNFVKALEMVRDLVNRGRSANDSIGLENVQVGPPL